MINYAADNDWNDNQAAADASKDSVDSNTKWSFSDKLPSLLRSTGAIAVLVALYSFLSKGWIGNNDLVKFYMLLANTVGLALLALFITRYLKEGKSPRLLLSLALVSVPINFTIMGAFIFFGASDFVGISYPTYAAWSVDSLSTAMVTSIFATAVLIPIAWLGFRTLARGMSQRMTGFFLLSNVLLLVPFRDPLFVAGLALVLGLLALLISAKTVQQQFEIRTKEGKIALLMQFLPLGILVGRNLWLYSADEVVIWATAAMVFIILRQVSDLVTSTMVRELFNALSLLTTIVVGLLTVSVLQEVELPYTYAAFFGALTCAGMIFEISLRKNTYRTFYRCLALVILLGASVMELLARDNFGLSIGILVTGVAILSTSYVVQLRSLSIAGAALIVVGLLEQFMMAFQWFDLGSWYVLLTIGIAAIVMASVLEAKGSSLKFSLRKHKRQFSEWNF